VNAAANRRLEKRGRPAATLAVARALVVEGLRPADLHRNDGGHGVQFSIAIAKVGKVGGELAIAGGFIGKVACLLVPAT